jgi:acetylornithine/succinyldiaminopimelate/putrescine aminotransferase
MRPGHAIADTYEQILREQRPNLLRLYLNPYVCQTCFCLDRYVRTTWDQVADADEYQSFLANGFDEALSGAIKLARYAASTAGRPTTGLVLDPAGRLGPSVDVAVAGGRVVFVPGLVVCGDDDDMAAALGSDEPFGFVVLVPGAGDDLERYASAMRTLNDHARLVCGARFQRARHAGSVPHKGCAPILITCLDREALAGIRSRSTGVLRELAPDIVVFDESFVDHAVPFGAFAARKPLYDHWNRPGKTTFHSTTYQPNTISTLHFMRCLASADPVFHAQLAPELAAIETDLDTRRRFFRRLYSPSLYRMIRMAGFDTADVRAAGDFVHVDGRPIFDAVSGVACSIRGHNPPSYADEIEGMGDPADAEARLAAELRDHTGLECMLPAVSGASAVETALRLALVAQFPRRHVLALKAGFGGKTLLALTGTANPAYKEHIDPLYADVLYIDPFAPDAEARIEAALQACPVAVVQVELIQAVGGVRRVPEKVIRYLDARRQQHGYLLLIDEVQTGMYRTGPLTLSRAMGLSPDLLLLGKGTCDMMFPFALVLYSAAVDARLKARGSDLPAALRRRHGYDLGYATVLNVLARADQLSLPERVAEAGALFRRLLSEGLASCKAVREVRVYGLLIGIELDAGRWPQRWFRKRLYSFYLYGMLRHRRFPVLVGFCQYEPNVLKITPSLTVTPDQIGDVCATIVDVLRRPFYRLLAAVLGGLVRGGLRRRLPARPKAATAEPAPVSER